MDKIYMTHDEVLELLRIGNGYNMPRGWKNKEVWRDKVYRMWKDMWRRCYDPESRAYRLYIESIIHDDFRLFSNFLNWIQAQPRFEDFKNTCHEVTWNIDKDVICPGNRHYFPEYMTLCLGSENSKEVNHRCQSYKYMHTDEARKKTSQNYKYMHTDEARAKAYKKLKKFPILGINIDDNTILIFKTISDVKFIDFDPSAIRNCCKNCYGKKKNLYKNYKWYYLDMNDRGDN